MMAAHGIEITIGRTRVSGLEGREGCIGRYMQDKAMYVAKNVMVAECVLGILMQS